MTENCEIFKKEYELVDTIYLTSDFVANQVYNSLILEDYAVMKTTQMVEGLGFRIRLDVLK